MKKNYSNASNTVNSAFKLEMAKANFIQGKDAIGSRVMGIVKNAKSKYESYSLAIVQPNGAENYANIPAWLGKNIMDDFVASGVSADEYFSGSDTITGYEDIETGKGNPTYNLIFN